MFEHEEIRGWRWEFVSVLGVQVLSKEAVCLIPVSDFETPLLCNIAKDHYRE